MSLKRSNCATLTDLLQRVNLTCGPESVELRISASTTVVSTLLEELNAELLALAVEGKVLRSRRLDADSILDEGRFLAPFRSRLTATIGRPTIPIETYLRLMYLKHR